jgi:hypothetical protein
VLRSGFTRSAPERINFSLNFFSDAFIIIVYTCRHNRPADPIGIRKAMVQIAVPVPLLSTTMSERSMRKRAFTLDGTEETDGDPGSPVDGSYLPVTQSKPRFTTLTTPSKRDNKSPSPSSVDTRLRFLINRLHGIPKDQPTLLTCMITRATSPCPLQRAHVVVLATAPHEVS